MGSVAASSSLIPAGTGEEFEMARRAYSWRPE